MPSTKSKNRSKKTTLVVPDAKVGRRFVIRWLVLCFALGFFGVVGFLLWQEYARKDAASLEIEQKAPPPSFKYFSNDYWGFKLYYPGAWSRVTGAVKDSEFYFASEPIDFLTELSSTEALLGVKAYNNFEHLSWTDWVVSQEKLHMPGQVVKRENTTFFKLPAVRYQLVPHRSEKLFGYYDMITVSKSDMTKLQIMLITSSKEKHADFIDDFNKILESITFYPGFGEEK